MQYLDLTSELRSFAMDGGPIVLYTAGTLPKKGEFTVTAEALLRHCGDRVVGVADERAGVETLAALEDWAWAGPIPVSPKPLELLAPGADLVVGLSLPGPQPMFDRHRAQIVAVADAGYRVFNGLHDLIDHPRVVNLRRFTEDQRLMMNGTKSSSVRIVTVGTSAEADMLTTTIELERALLAAGLTADWVPTSDAGVLIHGFGRCLDAVPLAFAAGILEEVILTVEAHAEIVVIEGQGSILDPARATAAATISQAGQGRYHVLCHRMTDPDEDPVSLLGEAATRYDAFHNAAGCRSTLLAVSLDTSALSEPEASRVPVAGQVLGVPCVETRGDMSSVVAALSDLTDQPRP